MGETLKQYCWKMSLRMLFKMNGTEFGNRKLSQEVSAIIQKGSDMNKIQQHGNDNEEKETKATDLIKEE